jgi:cytochrome c oxidase subunit 2
MIDAHTVREENGFPVVRPPVGSDVYLTGRLFNWWPILELEKDQSYRLHLSSVDVQHGFSIQVHPGYDMVVTVKPDRAGEYGIICNEFCGIGHHLMAGKLYVVE